LRGALPMAMALSLPQALAMREQLIVLTLALVLFTLVGPGLTIEPLIALLKIEREKWQSSNGRKRMDFLPDQPPEVMEASGYGLNGVPSIVVPAPESIDTSPLQ